MASTEAEESQFIPWAEAELRRAGWFSEDSDYDGMVGPSVMRLVREFANEGHSGSSAALTSSLFLRLSQWKPLSGITDDPDEWMLISEDIAGEPDLSQSRRGSSCFSHDGGKTYYDIEERLSRWRRVVVWVNWRLPGALRSASTRFYPRHRSQPTPLSDLHDPGETERAG